MTYRVVHRTEYLYDSEVSSSYGELYLLPRDAPGQVCHSSNILIEPEPHDSRERSDFYGNRVAFFTVLEPHTRLTVTAESIVDVTRAAGVPVPVDQPWEMVRERVRLDPTVDAVSIYDFQFDSPKVTVSSAVTAYAAGSFPTGRPLTEALTELTSRIHADFEYDAGGDVCSHHA